MYIHTPYPILLLQFNPADDSSRLEHCNRRYMWMRSELVKLDTQYPEVATCVLMCFDMTWTHSQLYLHISTSLDFSSCVGNGCMCVRGVLHDYSCPPEWSVGSITGR